MDYCSIQEQFKTVKSTDQWFRKQFRDFNNYVIPAHRAPGVENGRGMGGMVQLSLKSKDVKKIRIITKSPRIQAQVLSFPTCKIFWLNTYLPWHLQLQHFNVQSWCKHCHNLKIS